VSWREAFVLDLRVSCEDFERFSVVDLISVVGVSPFLSFMCVCVYLVLTGSEY
jgi:hypothetical protein